MALTLPCKALSAILTLFAIFVCCTLGKYSSDVKKNLAASNAALIRRQNLMISTQSSPAGQIMPPGENGVAVNHARAGISHDGFDFFSHFWFVAMDGTFCAGGFIFFKRAFFQTFFDIIKKVAALMAEALFIVMALATVNIEHQLNCFNFLLHFFTLSDALIPLKKKVSKILLTF